MPDAESIHVLVIFSCHTGKVERLALAAAVGAVQMRAAIRLRRIVDPSAETNDETSRMDRDYVAPRPEDVAWADVLILSVPNGLRSQIPAWGVKPVVSLTSQLSDPTASTGLHKDAVASDKPDVLPSRDEALQLGRRSVETARAR